MLCVKKVSNLFKKSLKWNNLLATPSVLKCKSQLKLYRKGANQYPEIFKQLLNINRNYESIKNNFEITPPEHFNFANDIIDQWAKMDKDDTDKPLAFWFVCNDGQEVKWTYEQLSLQSKKAANALKNLGAGTKWTRCLLVLPKMPEWWIINVACMRLGVILIPASAKSTQENLEYRIKHSNTQSIVASPSVAETIDSIRSEFPVLNTKILVSSTDITRDGWDDFKKQFDEASNDLELVQTKSTDISQVFFTSASTGSPKKVIHTHASIALGVYQFGRYAIELDRRKILWTICDLGWIKTTWSCIFAPWLFGATVFVSNSPTLDVASIIKILRDYPVEILCATPTVYRTLVGMELPPFKNLKTCITGGEAMNPEIITQWNARTGITIRDGFGQTETSIVICNLLCKPVKYGSMGLAVPGLQIDVIDETGNVLPPGQKGLIGIKVKPKRPLGFFLGYEDDDQRFSRCFGGDYFITGDIAHKDEDGYFWFKCRAEDVIISNKFLGAFEVENALLQHPDVLEAAVVGVLDPEKIQTVIAFVVLKESGKRKNQEKLKKELYAHAKTLLELYKCPELILFQDALPKTISGKIMRAELKNKIFLENNFLTATKTKQYSNKEIKLSKK